MSSTKRMKLNEDVAESEINPPQDDGDITSNVVGGKENPLQDEDDITSDDEFEEPTLKSLLDSWDLSELYQKLNENGYTYRTLAYISDDNDLQRIIGNDIHLNGPMTIFRSLLNKWQTDSASSSSQSEFPGPTYVKNLIDSTYKGKELLQHYKSNKILSPEMKKQLVKVILDDVFANNLTLSRSKMKVLSYQICKVFSNEKPDTYYDKKTGQQPTGLLHQGYYNAKRSKVNKKNKPLPPEEELSQHLTDEVEKSLEFLKSDDYQNGSLTLEHWKACFHYRQCKLSMSKIDEFIDDFPHLRAGDSYVLVHSDFKMKYGEVCANSLISNWDTFWGNNAKYIENTLNDPIMAKKLRDDKMSSDFDQRNITMALALHSVIIPSSCTLKRKRLSPTVPDSINCFFRKVKRLSDLKKAVKERQSYCHFKGLNFHPLIFQIETGDKFIVVITDDVEYEFDTFVDAMDMAFKLFQFFRIPFPPECKNFWLFINQVFYKIQKDDQLCNKIKMVCENLK